MYFIRIIDLSLGSASKFFKLEQLKGDFRILGLCTYINLNPFQISHLREKEREPNAKTRDSVVQTDPQHQKNRTSTTIVSSKSYLSSLYHEAYLQNEI